MRFVLVLLAVFFFARPAQAQLVNPGFESGDDLELGRGRRPADDDAGPDAGTIERPKYECAASPGSDAAHSWSVLFLLGVAVCACFRRARHAG